MRWNRVQELQLKKLLKQGTEDWATSSSDSATPFDAAVGAFLRTGQNCYSCTHHASASRGARGEAQWVRKERGDGRRCRAPLRKRDGDGSDPTPRCWS